MNYRLLFLIISFGLVPSSIGQAYESMVKPGRKWDHLCRHVSDPFIINYSIEIMNDTLRFKDKVYNKVKCYKLSGFDSLWVREEGKKVWFLDTGKSVFRGQEILMYNFNLEKGDTFRFKSPPVNSTDSFRVGRIIVSNTFIKDNRKYIEFNRTIVYENSSKTDFFPALYWIEGIGLSNGPYPMFYAYSSSFFSEFNCGLCVFENQKHIFPLSGICDSTIGITRNEKLVYKLYPNPAQKQFTIQLVSENEYKVQIYNTLGLKVDEFALSGKINYSIPCSYLKGIYRVVVSSGRIRYQSSLIIE